MSSFFVHPTAIVDEGAQIGEGTKIWHFVHVSSGARIGARCSLGQNVFVASNVPVGNGVKVQNNVSIYEGVEIEDDVFLGPSCVFTNVNNPRSFIVRKNEYRRTRVGRGASVGANATIVCGHDIGEYAFIGAGAVVTKNVAPYALLVGNPARRIGWMCRCGIRLPEGVTPKCTACGAGYEISGETCRPVDAAAPGAARSAASPPAAAQSAAAAEEPIPLVDLKAQNGPLLPAIRAAFDRVAESGHFILGEAVTSFERDVAAYIGAAAPSTGSQAAAHPGAPDPPGAPGAQNTLHAIGVSSGTDALLVALMALDIGPGDEVVTTPFSFFATAGCVARLGATPVFVDIDPFTFNLDPGKLAAAITPRTKAILPVHLFGQPCAKEIHEIAARHNLPVIEDAAQAIGAKTPLGPVGALGKFGCFSFFPSKNLGAFGDAGLVTTTDANLAERVRVLRAHGGKPKYYHAEIGGNFRIDAVQAAILHVKLPHLDRWAEGRKKNAQRYTQLFAEAALPPEVLTTPREVEPGHVWNQYVIRTPRRDALQAHFKKKGIGNEVYYPVPLHLQKCFANLGYKEGSMPVAERAAREVVAIPIFPELGEARLQRIVREVVAFLRG